MTGNIMKNPCVVCTEQQANTIPPNFDGIHQVCPRCGEFKISGTVLAILGSNLEIENRAKLSGWVLEQNRSGRNITGSSLSAPHLPCQIKQNK